MLFHGALLLAVSRLANAYNTADNYNSSASSFAPFSGNPFENFTITADGISASFIPYGARVTNLWVKDKSGVPQDVVLGYDNGTRYLTDSETNHTYFGAVVGRYANRIKNGTFTIDGETSHIPENEHGGETTLHGGFVGYDQQNWTVASYTGSSITFVFYDAAQSGFPGDVLNVATYTLTDAPAFISRLVSIPMNEATPIMLANHIYWNLGAYVDEEAVTVLNNTLYMPYADRIIDIDGIEVPTGAINITNGTAYDFTKPGKQIGQDIFTLENSCGTGCVGYDNAFIVDRPRYSQPDDPGLEVLRLWAPSTGIQMSLSTNQQGLQVYTCTGQNGTIPVKSDQQHLNSTTYVEKYGCIVIETQDWIDGINNPQWGRDQWQIFTPTTEPAVNYAKYDFSVVD
ncbi:galactose mutarotase-like protein [Teratosphaeria nubilosa]|uniref:Galactose mutarotase-like protein n=1 Tax=Teratosphaeria nubilosa TaxID=161662 RepID=A0A6G1L093_9PEZI|nr:galactose mutarotase-like protein [Teratosphaeria nubilosa]